MGRARPVRGLRRRPGRAPAAKFEAPAPKKAEAPAAKPPAPPPPKPEAAAPPAAPKPEASSSVGEIAALILASEETILSSQMAGRIRKVHVGLGDEAKSGAALIEFDCGEQRAQLAAADADYRSARETHVARLKLQALGAAGELEVTVAAAAADKARSQVTLRREQVAYCSVLAPFRSRVARLRVKGAESVQSGQPLVDLVNPTTLKAQIFVPAAWITWLKPGAPVTILANNGQGYQAKVSKLNSRVDGVSQQLELEATHREQRRPGARHDRRRQLQPAAVSETPNPVLALLEFERRIQSATSNREVAFRAVNDGSQVLRFDQAILWRVGRVLPPADRRRLGAGRRVGRQPLSAMAGAPGARHHARAVRGDAGARRRRAARGGGGRRRGLGAGASAALPAARPDRRGARRHPVLPLRAVLRGRAAPPRSGSRARPATGCGPGAATSTGSSAG